MVLRRLNNNDKTLEKTMNMHFADALTGSDISSSGINISAMRATIRATLLAASAGCCGRLAPVSKADD